MKFFFLTAVLFSAPLVSAPKCVTLYYDATAPHTKDYTEGQANAILIQNLVGHFPNWKVRRQPIESYQTGGIKACYANIYIGSSFDNAIPPSFLKDFFEATNPVAWLGYNVWELGVERLAAWGLEFKGLANARLPSEKENIPGFFKDFFYKGEIFEKYFAIKENKFEGAAELNLFSMTENSSTEVVSWAQHTWTQEKVPYILKNKKHWVVGDVPLSYMTEDDRYLIFADLLFDVLEEPPIWKKKAALVRIEDVHAKVPSFQFEGMVELFHGYGIPFAISVIPVFTDPLMAIVSDPKEKVIPLSNAPEFRDRLKKAKASGASLIYHGYTHQYANHKNPYNGVSGADYEFWDDVNHRPISEDSSRFVVERLEKGISQLDQNGLLPSIWVTPHYTSSLLDQLIFGQLYSWNLGRYSYSIAEIQQRSRLPSRLRMDRSGADKNGKRLSYFSDLKVRIPEGASPTGQFFPYEIYSDVYGNSLLPENLGYIQLIQDSTIPGVLERYQKRLKRNKVLRDVWASYYIHPYVYSDAVKRGVEFARDKNLIHGIIQATLDQDYDFVSLENWVATHSH